MNILLKSFLAASVIGISSMASALTIPTSGSILLENTDFDGKVNVGGGEFFAKINDFSFYTFCVEYNQHISLPGTYSYDMSVAVDSQGDVISKGTAYLFEAFVKGNLYARTLDTAHDILAGQLQTAIWILEDEIGFNTTYVANNPFIEEVESVFGSLAAAKVNGPGQVKVLNITRKGVQYQDVLIYVPDSGATLALLGMGLALVAGFRRRLRA